MVCRGVRTILILTSWKIKSPATYFLPKNQNQKGVRMEEGVNSTRGTVACGGEECRADTSHVHVGSLCTLTHTNAYTRAAFPITLVALFAAEAAVDIDDQQSSESKVDTHSSRESHGRPRKKYHAHRCQRKSGSFEASQSPSSH